jgi:hypothetical protein
MSSNKAVLKGDDNIVAKLAAGGLSCMAASAILNPMDVIKVRLQTQNQLQAKVGKGMYGDAAYKGFSHAGMRILREEGFSGIMKGITASMLREASYSSMRMGLYDLCKGFIAPNAKSKDDFTLVQKILAGMCSGAIGSSIANPTDLVKIRFQSFTPVSPNPYRNTFHAFWRIFQDEQGLRGLYKGIGPTTFRAAVLTGAQLSSYDHTKRGLLKTRYFKDDVVTHLSASFVSGLVTTTACNPFDIIKTRVMTDRKLYKGPIDCAIKTLKHEGPQAFFKGWLPNYLRLGPHFIMSIPLFEFFRKLFGADTL